MKKGWHIPGVVLAMVILMALVPAGCSQQPAASALEPVVSAPPASTADTGANEAPKGIPGEGIKVHGHWTIEVTNPDGSAAGKYEFENALRDSGATMLARTLARRTGYSIHAWMVQIQPAYGMPSPFLWDDGSGPGRIAESTFIGWDGPATFYTLTVNSPDEGDNAYKMVLSGTATAHQNGQIDVVSTLYQLVGTGVGTFTEAVLPSTVYLTAGQQVAVTVVISFS